MEYIFSKDSAFPKLGIGTYSLSTELLHEVLAAAFEMGYTFIDTANKYNNEFYIGEILSQMDVERSDYFIETKVHAELLLGNWRYFRLNAKSLKSVFYSSCTRLRTDYIDILMIHGVFKGYEKFIYELKKLKELKLIRYIGVCNVNLNHLKTLNFMNLLPDIVQVEVHPYHSNKEVIDFCTRNNIIVEARSPFAHGDALKDWLNEPVLQNIAIKHKATIPQIILRWITQQNLIALPRTSNLQHLKENIQSFNITLSEEDCKKIDSLNRNQSYGFVSIHNIHNLC